MTRDEAHAVEEIESRMFSAALEPPRAALPDGVREAAEYLAKCAGCGMLGCEKSEWCLDTLSTAQLREALQDDMEKARRLLSRLSSSAPAPSAKETKP